MDIFYFSIETQDAPTAVVAIFAKSAERASAISGHVMLNYQSLEPPYNGSGLILFRKHGRPGQLFDGLANAKMEGVAGYTVDEGWTVLSIAEPTRSERLPSD